MNFPANASRPRGKTGLHCSGIMLWLAATKLSGFFEGLFDHFIYHLGTLGHVRNPDIFVLRASHEF